MNEDKIKKELVEIMMSGDAKKITREYFESMVVEMRLMNAQMPNCETEIFGERFATPIMSTALSHLGKFHPDMPGAMDDYAKGAMLAETLHWVGMCENAQFEQLMKSGAKTVRIIKPYADNDKVLSQIECAKNSGAVAVGIDIDHTFTTRGKIDVVEGELMEIKTAGQIREYIKAAAGLPFVIKGVLSVHDAAAAAELGVSAVVVSHHGGRILYAAPPLMVLPEIKKEVGSVMSLIVDCGVRSGVDAYKAMALGADGVGVGNHLVPYIRKGGAEAVAARFGEMTEELLGMMAYTGVKDVHSFDASVIHRR